MNDRWDDDRVDKLAGVARQTAVDLANANDRIRALEAECRELALNVSLLHQSQVNLTAIAGKTANILEHAEDTRRRMEANEDRLFDRIQMLEDRLNGMRDKT